MATEKELKSRLFQFTKNEVVRHLESQRNQKKNISIKGHGDVSVKDLTKLIKKETQAGIVYMAEWLKMTFLVARLKRQEKL